MWFIGALAGAVLGAMSGQISGFFLGGLVGGVAGWMLGQMRARELEGLEKRVVALEEALGLRTPQTEPVPQAPEIQPRAEPEPEPEPEPEQRRVKAAPPQLEPVPAGPSALGAFWERLFGGNLVVKVGVVVLFFGVAFLLRYAYERVHVPIELRLAGIAAGHVDRPRLLHREVRRYLGAHHANDLWNGGCERDRTVARGPVESDAGLRPATAGARHAELCQLQRIYIAAAVESGRHERHTNLQSKQRRPHRPEWQLVAGEFAGDRDDRRQQSAHCLRCGG